MSPVFLICALILIGAAIGLRPGMASLAERYRKKSIDPRRPFDHFDVSRLPSFQESPGPLPVNISADMVDTEDYLLIGLKDEGRTGPEMQAFLFVTYYSDPKDKVPHTPEVCYRQGGSVVENMTTITLDTPELAPEHPRIQARSLQLRHITGRSAIVYTFCVNGEFRYDREQVRWAIAKPGDPYIYFSKIEAVAQYRQGTDPAIATEWAKKLLREALPILVSEHYPDTAVVKGR